MKIQPNDKGTTVQELIDENQFNQLVSTMLILFAEHLEVPTEQIMIKIIEFNNQLETKLKTLNEKSIQLGQDDQTTN
ncbi:MAG: hypothetical protein [Microvirus sp.]|nr:MAG: hypothetical protein [Microvirus sp.]